MGNSKQRGMCYTVDYISLPHSEMNWWHSWMCWYALLHSSCVFSVTHTLGSHLFSSNMWVVQFNVSAGFLVFFLRNTHFFLWGRKPVLSSNRFIKGYTSPWKVCCIIKTVLEIITGGLSQILLKITWVFEICLLFQYKLQRNLHV